MRHPLRHLVLYSALTLLAANPPLAAGHSQLPPLQAVTEPWAPYNTFSNEQTADGANALVVQRALALSGLKAPILIYPWARAMALGRSRPNTLLFSLARTPEREDKFIWLGKLHQAQQFLWRLSDTISPTSGGKLQQIIACCSICTVRKDVSEDALREQDKQQQLQLVLTGHHQDCLRLLRGNSVQYLAASPYRIKSLLQQHGLPASLLHREVAIAPPRELYLAASQGTPAATVHKLQQAMRQLHDSGESEQLMQQLLSRPLPGTPEPGNP